jgi:hypothetical protein
LEKTRSYAPLRFSENDIRYWRCLANSPVVLTHEHIFDFLVVDLDIAFYRDMCRADRRGKYIFSLLRLLHSSKVCQYRILPKRKLWRTMTSLSSSPLQIPKLLCLCSFSQKPKQNSSCLLRIQKLEALVHVSCPSSTTPKGPISTKIFRFSEN